MDTKSDRIDEVMIKNYNMRYVVGKVRKEER